MQTRTTLYNVCGHDGIAGVLREARLVLKVPQDIPVADIDEIRFFWAKYDAARGSERLGTWRRDGTASDFGIAILYDGDDTWSGSIPPDYRQGVAYRHSAAAVFSDGTVAGTSTRSDVLGDCPEPQAFFVLLIGCISGGMAMFGLFLYCCFCRRIRHT